MGEILKVTNQSKSEGTELIKKRPIDSCPQELGKKRQKILEHTPVTMKISEFLPGKSATDSVVHRSTIIPNTSLNNQPLTDLLSKSNALLPFLSIIGQGLSLINNHAGSLISKNMPFLPEPKMESNMLFASKYLYELKKEIEAPEENIKLEESEVIVIDSDDEDNSMEIIDLT